MITPHKKLRADQVNCLIPTNVTIALTGINRITQDKSGMVTLHYTSGTKKSKHLGANFELTDAKFSDAIDQVEYEIEGRM